MLLTLADLKSRLGIANTADDTRLTALITQVGARFAKFCDRDFERATAAVEYHDPLRFLVLRHFPAETLALYYDTSRVFGATTLLTVDEHYIFNAANGHVYLSIDTCQRIPLTIKAIVTGGYVPAGTTPGTGQTAIPEDIARAVLQQCEFEWKNHSEFGRQSISLQGQSVSVAEYNLLPEVKATLNSYRRITL